MRDLFQRLAAATLKLAIRALPEPDAARRPVVQDGSVSQHRRKSRNLDYVVPLADLSRIFHLSSDRYEDEVESKGLEIRTIAGHPPIGNHETVHGFGDTKILRSGHNMNLYVNEIRGGAMSSTKGLLDGINNGLQVVNNTLWYLPRAIMRSKRAESLVDKAAHVEPIQAKCEQSIVGRASILADDPKRVIFAIRAEYMSGSTDERVFLRDVFMPVVNDDGAITGTCRIDPQSPDCHVDTLRALIFFKLFTDDMVDKKPVDVAANLKAVWGLPLNKESRLKDYLTFRP